jgi:hypothetical protein
MRPTIWKEPPGPAADTSIDPTVSDLSLTAPLARSAARE